MLCINFVHECRDPEFSVDSSRQKYFWESFPWQFYFLSDFFLPEICWEQHYSLLRTRLIPCCRSHSATLIANDIAKRWNYSFWKLHRQSNPHAMTLPNDEIIPSGNSSYNPIQNWSFKSLVALCFWNHRNYVQFIIFKCFSGDILKTQRPFNPLL